MARRIWEIEVRHSGLGKYRHIRGYDKHVVEQKAAYQKQQWDEQWQRKLDAERRVQDREREVRQRTAERDRVTQEKARVREETARTREELAQEKARQKEEAQRYKDSRKQEAVDRDTEAKEDLNNLSNTLKLALDTNNVIDWSKLKDFSSYGEQPPKLVLTAAPDPHTMPVEPAPLPTPGKPAPVYRPPEPNENNPTYQPVFGILDKIIASRKARKIGEAAALLKLHHDSWVALCTKADEEDGIALKKWEDTKKLLEEQRAAAHADWLRAVDRTKTENADRRAWWEKQCEVARAKHEEDIKEWEKRKEKFLEEQKEANTAVDGNKERYLAGEPEAVSDYCDSVLSNSLYPDYFPKEWDLDYNADTRTLLIEYGLPAPEDLPTLKEVQYVQTKDDFKETYLSEKERDSLYDSVLYQIALRTIYEQFQADKANALDAVSFTGIVTALDKTTGHKVTACVLSVIARKGPFQEINLSSVDPKACFKSLKGVAASKLAGLTAVSPIMVLNKDDRRFVDAYGVAEHLTEGTNLATMDWEDFEHLIRELFEQEFATGGGEVKVTQASRDGGVDAVAFDPDPIRGGKIVIQAKRYANTVGVSAVRDLYGTVMNEGAIKGILVTTADYGPDAYEFAKGKPLTLLNGSNLLHLLEKHGRQARINLHEARQENRQAMLAGGGRRRNVVSEESDGDTQCSYTGQQ